MPFGKLVAVPDNPAQRKLEIQTFHNSDSSRPSPSDHSLHETSPITRNATGDVAIVRAQWLGL